MSIAVVTAETFQEALDEILRASMDIMGADFGDVQLLDPEEDVLKLVIQHGFDEQFCKSFDRVARGDTSACGRAFRMRRRVVVRDIKASKGFGRLVDAASKAGFSAVQSTPLTDRTGKIIGMLSTHFKEPRSISEREAQLLDLLAQQASALVERLRMESQLKEFASTLEASVEARTREVRDLASQLAIVEHGERHRIAQILHDDLQQMLYSMQMKLEMLSEETEAKQAGKVMEAINQLDGWVKGSIEKTRQLTLDLSPQVLDNEGLAEAIAWLAEHMRERHGLVIDVQAEQRLVMPKEMRVLLFRAVRELLFNVVKHAETNNASVELRQDNSDFRICVRDNGKGFDPTLLPDEKGFGMASIRNHLALFGGHLEVNSSPGTGSSVTICMPLRSN